jgi:hypothetical protein
LVGLLVHNQASAVPIVPEICVEYADQIRAVVKSPSLSSAQVLDDGFQSGRSYRWPRILQNLDEQFQALNQSLHLTPGQQLTGNQRYLRDCMNDPTQCHGYFVQNIDRFTPLYCGHSLLKLAMQDGHEDVVRRTQQCITHKDQFFEKPHMENPRFIQACLNPDTMEYKDFESEYEYLKRWNEAYQQKVLTAGEQSPEANAFYYMYQKAVSELDQYQEMSSSLALTVQREHFQQQLRACPIGNVPNRLQRSYGYAQKVFSQNYTLQPQDLADQTYVKQLNIQYLEEKFTQQTPQDLSQEELLEWYIFRLPNLTDMQDDVGNRKALVQRLKSQGLLYKKFALYEDAYLPDYDWQAMAFGPLPQPSDTYASVQMAQESKAKQTIPTPNHPQQQLPPTQAQLLHDLQSNRSNKQTFEQQITQGSLARLTNAKTSLSFPAVYARFFHGSYPKVVIQVAMSYFLQQLFIQTMDGHTTEFASFPDFIQKFQKATCNMQPDLCSEAWHEQYEKDFYEHYQRFANISFEAARLEFELKDLEKKIKVANDYCHDMGKNAQELATLSEEDKSKTRQALEILSEPVFQHPYFQSIMTSEKALDWLGLKKKDIVEKCLGAGVLFGSRTFNAEIRELYANTSNRSMAITYNKLAPYKDYRPKDANVRSTFSLKREKLAELTAHIREALVDKLDDLVELRGLYHLADKPTRSVLEARGEQYTEEFQSMLEHYPLPVLEYFQDQQTMENGYFLCGVMLEMRDRIQEDAQKIQQYNTILIALSALALPVTMGMSSWLALTSEAAMAVNAYVFGALSVAYGGLNIYELVELYELKNDAVASMATGHTSAYESADFLNALEGQIHSAWLNASIGVLLFASLEAPFVYKTGKRFVRETFSKEFREVQKRRMAEMEDIRKVQDPEQNGHFFDDGNVFHSITSVDQVSRQDYRKFINILHDQTVQRTKNISDAAKIERIRKEQEILAKNFLREAAPKLQNRALLGPAEQVTASNTAESPTFMKKIKARVSRNVEDFRELARPLWYRFLGSKKAIQLRIQLRTFLIKRAGTQAQRFAREAKLLRYLQKLQAVGEKLNVEFLTKNQYQALLKEMKYFVDDRGAIKPFVYVDGKKVAFSTREKFLHKAMLKQIRVKSNLLPEIDHALRVLIRSHIFDKFNWVHLLRNFDGKIENIIDCRAFERAVEFAVYEETNIWQQLRRSFGLDSTELLSRKYYQKRKELISQHFNDFFTVAQYGKYREYQVNMQIARRLQSDYGFTLEQIEVLYRKRYLDSFDLRFALAHRNIIETRVAELENSMVLNRFINHAPSSQTSPGAFSLMPSKEVFLKRFYRSLEKEMMTLQKGFNEDMAKMSRPTYTQVRRSFKKNYHRAKVRSMVYRECANPTSAIRNLSNNSMNRFMMMTGAVTEAGAYTVIHRDDDMTTGEFWSRAMFDVTLKTLGNFIRSKVFTSKATPNTPIRKIGKETVFMAGMAAVLDAPMYTLAEKHLWGHGDEWLANDQDWEAFVQQMSLSPELRQQPLKPYNRLISDDHAFYLDYKAILDQVTTQVEEILAEHPEIQTENQLYDHLVNQKLLTKIADSGDTQEQLLDWYADYLAEQYPADHEAEDERFLNQALDWHPVAVMAPEAYNSENFSIPVLSPMFLDDLSDEAYEGINRWLFYRAWDVTSGSHISYVKNYMIYTLLCKARIHPSWNMRMAKATYIAVTSAETYAKLLLREKATGK